LLNNIKDHTVKTLLAFSPFILVVSLNANKPFSCSIVLSIESCWRFSVCWIPTYWLLRICKLMSFCQRLWFRVEINM
jgi:hypothetical protein